MRKVPDIIPITDLRQSATAVVGRIKKSRQPVVITQRGRAAAVLVSMDVYEESQRELEILKMLALGEKELEAGTGYSLAEVFAEADALLKKDFSLRSSSFRRPECSFFALFPTYLRITQLRRTHSGEKRNGFSNDSKVSLFPVEAYLNFRICLTGK